MARTVKSCLNQIDYALLMTLPGETVAEKLKKAVKVAASGSSQRPGEESENVDYQKILDWMDKRFAELETRIQRE